MDWTSNATELRITREDALQAARMGLSKDEYIEYRRAQEAEAQRDRKIAAARGRRPARGQAERDLERSSATVAIPRGDRIELDDREYMALCLVVAAANRLIRCTEAGGGPTKEPEAWNILHKTLAEIKAIGWANFGGFPSQNNQVESLLDILAQTRPDDA